MKDEAGVVASETAAKLLMMSERHLRRLVADGWVTKTADDKYTVVGCVQGYIRYLKDEARRGNQTDAKTYVSEVRARLAQEQADNMALKNAALRAEMVSVADVEMTWGTMVRDLRAGVLAIASRVASRLNHLSKDDVLVIDDEIRDALKILGADGVKDAPQGP